MDAIHERLKSHDWSKPVLRFEITFFGFDILHNQETGKIMAELEEWINSLIIKLEKEAETIDKFTAIVNE